MEPMQLMWKLQSAKIKTMEKLKSKLRALRRKAKAIRAILKGGYIVLELRGRTVNLYSGTPPEDQLDAFALAYDYADNELENPSENLTIKR